jgi:hypothetical protein
MKIEMNPDDLEPAGRLISLSFQAIPFMSCEIWNFIEQITKLKVEDLSVFRDVNGVPTGTVVAQLTDDVTESRLHSFNGALFKNCPIEVRLFPSQSVFRKFLLLHSGVPPPNVAKLLQNTVPPMVYVMNYEASEDELKGMFSKCGEISTIVSHQQCGKRYFVLNFACTAGAKLAYGLYDAVNGMKVGLLYKRAAERAFVLRGTRKLNWIKEEVSGFGAIEGLKMTDDGWYCVLMETLDAAKASCVLLNGRLVGEERISTHFVDFEYFTRLK